MFWMVKTFKFEPRQDFTGVAGGWKKAGEKAFQCVNACCHLQTQTLQRKYEGRGQDGEVKTFDNGTWPIHSVHAMRESGRLNCCVWTEFFLFDVGMKIKN